MENICDWKRCKKTGHFKAPIEKDNSRKFRWLCVDHIKVFNKKWDYFEGMTQSDIENFLKSDSTWHRPTQSFNSSKSFFNMLWKHALDDKLKILGDYKFKNMKNGKKLTPKDKEAFKIMELNLDSSWNKVQKKFKTLVKKFHPDMNYGNKIYENKLKEITIAYNHLKTIMKQKNI